MTARGQDGLRATRNATGTSVLHGIARLSATAVVVPLAMLLIGEGGSGPQGVREWICLALFPVGFGFGYLLGWSRALLGGASGLACMAARLLVIARTFPARMDAI